MAVYDLVIVKMELIKIFLSLHEDVVATCDVAAAFKDVDVAALVGAMPRREGMERKDLLKANVKIFKQQGEALDKYAKKDVKVSPVSSRPLLTSFVDQYFFDPSLYPLGKPFWSFRRLAEVLWKTLK